MCHIKPIWMEIEERGHGEFTVLIKIDTCGDPFTKTPQVANEYR